MIGDPNRLRDIVMRALSPMAMSTENTGEVLREGLAQLKADLELVGIAIEDEMMGHQSDVPRPVLQRVLRGIEARADALHLLACDRIDTPSARVAAAGERDLDVLRQVAEARGAS